jgi:uncharacterized protein (DUF1697 family)
MARVTSAEVLAIMDNCPLTDVDTFIEAGTLLIDSVFGATNTDGLTKEIERWFVAHMVASTKFRTTSDEKVGDASVTYTGKWGMNLDSTPYGQMCKVLDVTGVLGNLGKMKASIYAVKGFE